MSEDIIDEFGGQTNCGAAKWMNTLCIRITLSNTSFKLIIDKNKLFNGKHVFSINRLTIISGDEFRLVFSKIIIKHRLFYCIKR